MFLSRSIRWRAKIGGWVLVLAVTGSAGASPVLSPPNLAAIQRQALALMADITPHEPTAGTPIKVSRGVDHAFWGTPFGDHQIAALVAVDLVHGKDHEPGDNADLCLLRWDHGWKFQQWAGKIAATVDYAHQWDWDVKRRQPADAWYVVSRLNLNSTGEHLSWRCDAGTHMLVPTGWPSDAVPSISGDTITFTHQDKPGNSPVIRDIYRFTYPLSEPVASRTGDDVLTLRDTRSSAVCTWQAKQVIRKNYTSYYSLCRSEGKALTQPLREDAVAEFDWAGQQDGGGSVLFMWSRLSGLSDNALQGDWDQDGRRAAAAPRRVTVTGLPEAIQRLGWPPGEESHP